MNVGCKFTPPQQKEEEQVNRENIEKAMYTVLKSLGEDPEREGLKETPKRVAKMYEEMFASVGKTNDEIISELGKTFTEKDKEGNQKFGDMVIVRDIPFYSTCEHHLVPFFGKAHVGYIPNKKVIGLSKIARLVEAIAKRPQIQERITKEVADCLVSMLEPVGVIVVIQAEHLCMSMRGVKKPGSNTVTSAARGAFKDDQAARMEFLQLIKE